MTKTQFWSAIHHQCFLKCKTFLCTMRFTDFCPNLDMQGQTNEHRYRREIKTRWKSARFYKLWDKGIKNTSPPQQFEYTLSEPQGTVHFFFYFNQWQKLLKSEWLQVNQSHLAESSTLSRANVLVTANPQPASKPRLIIAALVVGGALAKPNGFSNFNPQISTLKSTLSISV